MSSDGIPVKKYAHQLNKIMLVNRSLTFLIFLLIFFDIHISQGQVLSIGTFKANVTPPLGSPVAYAPARKILDPLTARGVVIKSDQKPIVLCAVDYLGIANEGLEEWKSQLAKAAETTPDRVWVSTLHQHDGMRCDLTLEEVLEEYGLAGTRLDVPVIMKSIEKTARAVRKATKKSQTVTHLGFGRAEVEKVASNRRIVDPVGDTVSIVRWSRTTDSAAIAAPEGLIDPWLHCISFWNVDKALAVMTFYATHPQSYYGMGDVTSEFVGLARKAREKKTKIPHIHFNGASGNITAGKYNDGSKEMRPVLAYRMMEGMTKAWENTKKMPITTQDLAWKTKPVSLPLGKHLIESELRAMMAHDSLLRMKKFVAAKHLAWLLQTKAGKKIDISLLKLGKAWMLNLPGELFIEYQLAAQNMVPDIDLSVVAYGEYGPGYIGTEKAYSEGGYETSERASRVAPSVERILMKAIKSILLE